MSRYFTPSALRNVYLPRTESTIAIALLRETLPPLRLSSLHRLELELALKGSPKALKHWREDQANGLYEFVDQSLDVTVANASEFAATLSAQLDSNELLHLAIAQGMGCTEWVSFDDASRQAAMEAGFAVLPTSLPDIG